MNNPVSKYRLTKYMSSNWNDFSRVNASQRWRSQSASMGRHMTQAVVFEARVEPGMHVLDVASGTGEPAISIAALLQGTGKVVASDVSAEPLKIAEQRARERELTNLEFVRADVHELPFPDVTFDRVTSRLGIMFFAGLPRALRELHRVLKPSGRITLLAWGPMDQPYFATTIGVILRLLPELTIPCAAAAMFKFAKPGTLTSALEVAGFQQVEERLETLEWNWPGTPEDFWEYFRAVTVPFKPLLEAVPADRQEEIRSEVLAGIRLRFNGSVIEFGALAVLASAVVCDTKVH
jgi:ubiquinone/menaquinone biosynthesis C-methylase UbiE